MLDGIVGFQHKGYLYWTDWQLQSIERVDKNTGKGQMTIQNHMEGLMDVQMVAASRQTGE